MNRMAGGLKKAVIPALMAGSALGIGAASAQAASPTQYNPAASQAMFNAAYARQHAQHAVKTGDRVFNYKGENGPKGWYAGGWCHTPGGRQVNSQDLEFAKTTAKHAWAAAGGPQLSGDAFEATKQTGPGENVMIYFKVNVGNLNVVEAGAEQAPQQTPQQAPQQAPQKMGQESQGRSLGPRTQGSQQSSDANLAAL